MKVIIEIDVEYSYDPETKKEGFVARHGWTPGGRAVLPKRAATGFGDTLDEAVADVLNRVIGRLRGVERVRRT